MRLRVCSGEIVAEFGQQSQELHAAHLSQTGLVPDRAGPYNNIVRTAVEAMAAAFGGTHPRAPTPRRGHRPAIALLPGLPAIPSSYCRRKQA